MSFQVFSRIEATLSGTLLEAIPGNKSEYLKNNLAMEESDIQVKDLGEDLFSVVCPATELCHIYNKLSRLVPEAMDPFRPGEKRHKGVNCDLLRPMFSRSGREVKPKQYDIPVDDEAVSNTDEDTLYTPGPQSNVLMTTKRKRGRPRKKEARDVQGRFKSKPSIEIKVNKAPDFKGALLDPKGAIYLGPELKETSEGIIESIGQKGEDKENAETADSKVEEAKTEIELDVGEHEEEEEDVIEAPILEGGNLDVLREKDLVTNAETVETGGETVKHEGKSNSFYIFGLLKKKVKIYLKRKYEFVNKHNQNKVVFGGDGGVKSCPLCVSFCIFNLIVHV